mmetsp:Transcript_74187/g.176879  ORF Transcript_74187/g.176879 Transcript_74187/m.176879 type:complete len:335 (-) Transcript_74187:7269-8273(-)
MAVLQQHPCALLASFVDHLYGLRPLALAKGDHAHGRRHVQLLCEAKQHGCRICAGRQHKDNRCATCRIRVELGHRGRGEDNEVLPQAPPSVLLNGHQELLLCQALQKQEVVEVVKLVELIIVCWQLHQMRSIMADPRLPFLQIVGHVLTEIRTTSRRVLLDGVHIVPHLLSEEVWIRVRRLLRHVQKAQSPEQQRPLRCRDLTSMALERSGDQERAGELVVLEEASAYILEDAVQNLVGQVRHANINVITPGRLVHARLEQPHEVKETELIHRVDVGEICNHKIENASPCGNLCVLLASRINLHGGFLRSLDSLVNCRGRLFGLSQRTDQHLVV